VFGEAKRRKKKRAMNNEREEKLVENPTRAHEKRKVSPRLWFWVFNKVSLQYNFFAPFKCKMPSLALRARALGGREAALMVFNEVEEAWSGSLAAHFRLHRFFERQDVLAFHV
jgi:hypothetical protein